MSKFTLSCLLGILLASPAQTQQLPDFNIEDICARGADAVSRSECEKNDSSVFCRETGRHAIETLCVSIDQDSKSELLRGWESVPFEQKRTCIIRVLSEPLLSYNAMKKCVNDGEAGEPIADGPAYGAEYWFGSPSIVVPMHDLDECRRARVRAGNTGFCVRRNQT